MQQQLAPPMQQQQAQQPAAPAAAPIKAPFGAFSASPFGGGPPPQQLQLQQQQQQQQQQAPPPQQQFMQPGAPMQGQQQPQQQFMQPPPAAVGSPGLGAFGGVGGGMQMGGGGVGVAGGSSGSGSGGGILPMAEVDASLQCSPAYMALTLGAIPKDAALLAKSALPLGVVCHPLSEAEGSMRGRIPLVNFGASGVVRCKKCRAYINPFARFTDGGRRWRCNFCAYVNDVSSGYFSPTDEHGVRADVRERPELCSGSVEFVAPVEYMVRPPQPPVYVFVLDVSYSAVAAGILSTACASIRASLDHLPGGDRTQVGFITHDTSVHFYAIKRTPPGSAYPTPPSVLIVSDLEDLFQPVPEDLLVNLSECRESIDLLLSSIPTMYAHTRAMDSALGPALEGAYHISHHIGGKVLVVQACLPTLGGGKLKAREAPKMLGGDKEHTLLAPDPSDDGSFYKTKAVDFSKQQLSVDFFLFNPNYADVATLGALSRYTAGQVYWYGSSAGGAYNPVTDGPRFGADLSRDLTRTTGFEAVMRVRGTKGITVTNFYGNFFIRGTDLLALPNVTSDTAFNVELAYDPNEPLQPGSVVAVQAALLYTTASGERRIAVHTLARPVTSLLADLFRTADCDVVADMMAKVALDNALRTGLPSARRYLHKTLVDVIRSYKASTSGGGGYGASMGGMSLSAPSGTLSRMPMPMGGPGSAPGGAPGGGAPGAAGSGSGGGGGTGGVGSSSDVSSMLPESLSLLPLYAMGLQKSPAYRGGEFIRSDERAALVYRILSMPLCGTRPFIYPRLYSLHDMENHIGRAPTEVSPATEPIAYPHPHAGPRVVLPATVTLSAASLNTAGCFLLDNGVELYLWVGRSAPSGLVNALFGVPSLTALDASEAVALTLTDKGNDYSARVCAIVRTLRGDASATQRLRIAREGAGDPNEARFHWHLVEDRQNFQGGTVSYAEYVAIAAKEAAMVAQAGIAMGGGT